MNSKRQQLKNLSSTSFFFLVLSMALSKSVSAQSGIIEEWIPDVLISMESTFPAGERTIRRAIVVEKATQRLYLYRFDEGGYHLVFDFPCSTGKSFGTKQRSGDKKTPEGVYFFTQHHPRRELSAIYGSRAFPMDYPNAIDRLQQRGGYAIWMHGTNKPLKARDSNGCIVLTNEDIDRLAAHITLFKTPIIIVEKVCKVPVGSRTEIAFSVAAFLKDHYEALAKGNRSAYQSGYAFNHGPSLSWWPKWLGCLNSAWDLDIDIRLLSENRAIYKADDLYVVTFDEIIATDTGLSVLGRKKLFIRDCGDTFEILEDNYLILDKRKDGQTDTYPGIDILRQMTERIN
jgi:murein L,D-transpeptidase YafK